jgi:hypothetical protein
VAVKPNEVDPPGAIVALYAAFLTVIAPLDPVFDPFQRLEMLCPAASVIRTVQPLSVDAPVFRTVTSAWYPPDQLLVTVYAAAHPLPPGGGVEG